MAKMRHALWPLRSVSAGLDDLMRPVCSRAYPSEVGRWLHSRSMAPSRRQGRSGSPTKIQTDHSPENVLFKARDGKRDSTRDKFTGS